MKAGLRFFKTKEGVGVLAIIVTGLLAIMKLVASFITGSLGLRADAVHSVVDMSGAVIGLVGMKIAARPPDKGHAFGHGKAENLAGTVIGLLIFGAAVFIAYEAIERMVSGAVIEMVATGIYITIVAIVLNLSIAWYGLRMAKANESVALEATSRDLMADSMSSIAVLLGLILVAITGNSIFDSLIALLVSVVILRTAIITLAKSGGGLMDRRLPAEEEEIIRSILNNHSGVTSFHRLRTRKSGSERYIDLNLVLPKSYTVEKAHAICDQIEAEIKSRLPRSRVIIHIEPHKAKQKKG